ncbi:MAG: hypothetical protein QW840_04360 [Candidatus Bathyarchaeia archaeon]
MSTSKPSNELTVEETIRKTFSLYMREFVTFFAPSLILMLTYEFAISRFYEQYKTVPPLDPNWSSAEILNYFSTYLVPLLSMLLAILVVFWILSVLVSGIIIKAASELTEKGVTSLETAFIFTIGKIPRLLLVNLIVSILIALGAVAFIIPGIIVFIVYSLTQQAVIIEDAKALDSLSRSKTLVSNRWLKTFALTFSVWLITLFVYFVGSLLAAPFGAYSWIASGAITALATPLPTIALTVHYYSMLAREQQKFFPLPPPPF